MSTERELIELLVAVLRETEIGYTVHSQGEMCNVCWEVKSEGRECEFQHRPDCKWQAAMSAAEKYLERGVV